MSRIVDVEPLDCLAWKDGEHGTTFDDGVSWLLSKIDELPAVQPETHDKRTETHACDLISRQAAIDALSTPHGILYPIRTVEELPSAQPERTCVNCGRTVNNGGWYADGGTRCPIEEHYALPKGGYCHLWEKRNITDDDYPERRTDE